MTAGPLGLVPPEGDPSRAGEGTPDRWLLQAEAAALAGCSVSAIRKWRREGSVASRRTTTSGGLERVEVRLADVVARSGSRGVHAGVTQPAGTQPAGTVHLGAIGTAGPLPGAPPPGTPVPGTVVVTLADLHTLLQGVGGFQGAGGAERPRPESEARYRSLESEVSHLRGQVADLRRAVDRQQAESGRRIGELEAELRRAHAEIRAVRDQVRGVARGMRSGDEPARQASVTPSAKLGSGSMGQSARPDEVPDASPGVPSPVLGRAPARPGAGSGEPEGAIPDEAGRSASFQRWLDSRPAPPAPEPPAARPLERLAAELRLLYHQLAARRQQPDTADTDGWARDLMRYDTLLLRACARFGVATGSRPGDRLAAGDRVELTRALAQAGLDVRAQAVRSGRHGR